MAKIIGLAEMTYPQLHAEVQAGAKFVIYTYCISVILMTFRRSSAIYFLKPGENAMLRGLRYTLLSIALGWWGIPWGLIYTPMCIFKNFNGGENVTDQVMAMFLQAAREQAAPDRRSAED